MHALLAALPAGYPPHAAGPGDRAPRPDGAPVPLDVRLVPHPLTNPARGVPSELQSVIRSGGGGAEERADAAPMLAPSPRVPGIPVPRYLDPKELTRRARVLEDIEPSPDELEGRPGSGKIVLVLFISETGKVDRVELESSRLEEPFPSSLSRQFLAARFAPAERDGIPVKSRMRVEVVVRPLAK